MPGISCSDVIHVPSAIQPAPPLMYECARGLHQHPHPPYNPSSSSSARSEPPLLCLNAYVGFYRAQSKQRSREERRERVPRRERRRNTLSVRATASSVELPPGRARRSGRTEKPPKEKEAIRGEEEERERAVQRKTTGSPARCAKRPATPRSAPWPTPAACCSPAPGCCRTRSSAPPRSSTCPR